MVLCVRITVRPRPLYFHAYKRLNAYPYSHKHVHDLMPEPMHVLFRACGPFSPLGCAPCGGSVHGSLAQSQRCDGQRLEARGVAQPAGALKRAHPLERCLSRTLREAGQPASHTTRRITRMLNRAAALDFDVLPQRGSALCF